jgi:hypothetical protein
MASRRSAREAYKPRLKMASAGGVPLLVEKAADAGSRSRILRGGRDRLIDHLLEA